MGRISTWETSVFKPPLSSSFIPAFSAEAEEHAAELRTLTDHHHISVLKDSKGKLTLKMVKDRLAATGDKVEQKTLQKYLDADRQQKANTKEAAELLADVESAYRMRLKADPLPEELADLQSTVRYLDLLDEQSALRAKAKEADAALDQLAYDKYPTLSAKEIKALVVDDKWLPTLASGVQSELERVSQTLTGRIRQLAERYATPLPQITADVEALEAKPTVTIDHKRITLSVRPCTDWARRATIMHDWHKSLLHDFIPPLINRWERKIGVRVVAYFLQRMRTKWGGCNHRAGHIRLNTELVKKPKDLVEYIVIHEMAHLQEPTHSERFVSILTKHCPSWREARAELNELPLSAETWDE